MSELLVYIKDLGFPAFTFYLMYKLADGTIRENTKAITELKEAINKLAKEEKTESD